MPTESHRIRPTATAAVVLAMATAAMLFLTLDATSVQANRPDAPTGVSVTGGANAGELDVSWDAHPDGAQEYRLSWAPSDEDFRTWTDTDWNLFLTGTSHTITGLNGGDEYKVRVRARFQSRPQSPWSNVVTGTATASAQSTSVPATPARPTVDSVSHNAVTIAWTDPSDSSITGYQVLRRNPAVHDSGVFEVIEDDTGSADTSYEDRTVAPETTYRYRVKARNANGLSQWSKPAARFTTPAAPTPTNTSATGLPTITGIPAVGQTLSAETSGISDANGLTGVSYAYQWIRNDGTSDEEISGATGQTYTLTSNDHGKAIKVRVTFTDDDGFSESLTSTATGSVQTLTVVDPPSDTPAYDFAGGTSQAASVSEPAGQDLPDDNTTTGRVVVGDGGATGSLGAANDTDAFNIDLEAGKRYRIDVLGNGPRDFANGGTYAGDLELMVRTLQNTVGTGLERLNGFGTKDPTDTTINNVVNKTGGPDIGARSEFDVVTTATYLVKVISDGTNTGTYTVKASEITSEQAFGNFTSQWNSGRIKVDDTEAMTGDIDASGDSDWYMVSLEAGKCYSVHVKGEHPNQAHDGGTLDDPNLKVMKFFDYYEKRFYDPNTLAYVGLPDEDLTVAYYDMAYINPSNFELLNRADKVCNMVRPYDQSSGTKLVCNYYCDDDRGQGNNSLIKVEVSTGGAADYVIGVEGQGSTGTYSIYVEEITCPS